MVEKAKSKATSKTKTKSKSSVKAKAKSTTKAPIKKKAVSKAETGGVTLLSSGNPQIPMGLGEAPVKAYIAAMPGWKNAVGERLESLIEEAIPGVDKGVKWNTPIFGREGEGWYVSFYCYTKYITLTFFRGSSLKPIPPDSSKTEGVRYFKIFEQDELDEKQLKSWFKQASQLPGQKL